MSLGLFPTTEELVAGVGMVESGAKMAAEAASKDQGVFWAFLAERIRSSAATAKILRGSVIDGDPEGFDELSSLLARDLKNYGRLLVARKASLRGLDKAISAAKELAELPRGAFPREGGPWGGLWEDEASAWVEELAICTKEEERTVALVAAAEERFEKSLAAMEAKVLALTEARAAGDRKKVEEFVGETLKSLEDYLSDLLKRKSAAKTTAEEEDSRFVMTIVAILTIPYASGTSPGEREAARKLATGVLTKARRELGGRCLEEALTEALLCLREEGGNPPAKGPSAKAPQGWRRAPQGPQVRQGQPAGNAPGSLGDESKKAASQRRGGGSFWRSFFGSRTK